LAGHRVSTAFSPLDPFRTGFSVLIAPPTPDIADLRVDGRRLQAKAPRGDFQSYRQSDYMLLSIIGAEARGELSMTGIVAGAPRSGKRLLARVRAGSFRPGDRGPTRLAILRGVALPNGSDISGFIR
jgi:hypothetical protein